MAESYLLLKSRKRAACALVAFLGFVCAVPGTAAQGAMKCHPMETRPEVAPENLPAPQKLTGIGNAHIRITATAEAQMWFDQGLNLLHDFWDYESVRAFEQGLRVDPKCAMCYWGLYQAEKFSHSNSKYFADRMLKQAVNLNGKVSKSERLYIEASVAAEAARESEKKDANNADSKETELYRKLVKHDPKDKQARIYLANSLMHGYDDNGEPRAGTKEALAVMQSVLKEDP